MRFGDGYGVCLDEGAERVGREAVQHAAAGDEQRPLRFAKHCSGACELILIGRRRAKLDGLRREKRLRILIRHGLYVLRQRERHRAAQGRVGQHPDRSRQRGQQLLGMHDAIEVARHRPQAVVGRDAAVVEIFDLLQHRIGGARRKHVAGKEQHGQAIDVRERGCGDEIGRAGPDRGRAHHHPAPHVRLRISDRRVRHRLLVVRAIGGQLRAMAIQRLANARDVAMAEDREYATEERRSADVGKARLCAQRSEIAHERLRGGQAQPARRRSHLRRVDARIIHGDDLHPGGRGLS